MKLFSILILYSLLISCATVSPLSGGIKDTQPPKVLSSNPDSAQTLFYGTEIRLNFDEFFKVQNLQNELIISPPFDKPITHKIKGKSLLIQLPNYPLTNTTYQIHFGSSISDVNEGNILKDYHLVFSTGNALDSGSISGVVLNAQTKEPQIKHKVILYKNQNDSNIFKSLPYYLTYTDSFGRFSFNHIADTSYQIVTLDDKNLNNKLDFEEQVGFLISEINTQSPTETIYTTAYPDNRALYIKDSKCTNPGIFQIHFSKPITLKSLYLYGSSNAISSPQEDLFLPYTINSDYDEIKCFLSKSDVLTTQNDSMYFLIVVGDDTLRTTILNKCNDKFETKLSLKSNSYHYNQPINILSNNPIYDVNQEEFRIYNITDSTFIPLDGIGHITPDQEIIIQAPLSKGKEYRVTTSPAAIELFNQENTTYDTFFFRTYKDIELGETDLVVTIDSMILNQPNSIRIEISSKSGLNQKPNIIFSNKITKDTVIYLNQLLPREYHAIAYIDLNEDGLWTDANFDKKQLPEPIFIKKEPINIRANWQNKNIRFKIE